jgi:hypothetical protein
MYNLTAEQRDIFPLSLRGAAELHLHTPFDLLDPFEHEKSVLLQEWRDSHPRKAK